MSSEKHTVRGEVLEALPNLEYRVKIGESIVRCYTAGKMRINKVKVMISDKVDVVLPPGSGVGRIIRRL